MAQQGMYRNASIVTARPVVPGPIAEYTPPNALSSGSQLNEATVGGTYKATPIGSGSSLDVAQVGAPWPNIINGAIKFFNSWRPNAFRQIANHNVAGNYGAQTSLANFGTRHFEFEGFNGPQGGPIAGYPGAVSNPYIKHWNNLVPIIYGLRVVNPAFAGSNGQYGTLPQSVVSQFTTPTQFTPTGTATLANRAVVLQ